MRLSDLLAILPVEAAVNGGNPQDIEITGVAYDSRRVVPGALFVAVWHPGYAADRHLYARDAVAAGAAAVVVERSVEVPPGTTVITVPRTPVALGWLAAGFCGLPAQRLGLVGVTGTDGKTTTCTLATAILEASGAPTGMVTTVATKAAGAARAKAEHTSTPEAMEVQMLLRDTVEGGGRYAVIEATSHALDQDRLAGCEFDVAVVTRVTHEHMEYHGTRENYLAAKAKLLDLLHSNERHPKPVQFPKAAVLNVDDSSFAYMAGRSPVPVISYGTDQSATVRALDVEGRAWGSVCRVVTPWGEGRLELKMPGLFNVHNALAALSAGCVLGRPLDLALRVLAEHEGVTGRMQRIDAGQPFAVVVDFAHTPDSLQRVLELLRGATKGRLIVVFGSAGERDREKRPWMGRIAAEGADVAILADEDPRLEDPMQIIDEIASGVRQVGAQEGRDFLRISDRRQAIATALRLARPGDTVLLTGKGHEQSIIGARDGRLYVMPWDERLVAHEELESLGYAQQSPAT
jgi:UDP-N-acetylmuramoyl-L-alanyl-D-glutamate--2,6-diaminopimelate ligase